MNDVERQQAIKEALCENSYYVLNLLFILLGFPLRETQIALDVYCNKQLIEDTAEKFDCLVGTINNSIKRFVKRLLHFNIIHKDLKIPDNTLKILDLCIFKYIH